MAIVDFVKKHTKIIGIAVILLILLFLFRGKIRSVAAPEPKYETSQATRQNLAETISASGKVTASQEVTLRFQTSGYLSWVGVKVGDRVAKWQSIASLDQAGLEKELKQELIDYSNERWDFDQTQDDYHTGNQPPEKVAVNDEIKRILEKAQFDLDRIVIDVEIKNLALKYANLWTPIDGIVTEIGVPYAGVNITPAQATFTIANPDSVIFTAKVDEVDIGRVKIGQPVALLLDAFPDQTFNSTVMAIDFVSTTTSSGGNAYEVEMDLPENADLSFRSGMKGDTTIQLEKLDNTLVVPLEAIRDENGSNYVWLLEDGKPLKKKVTIGLGWDEVIEIKDGLEEGETVITSDFKLLEKK